MMADHTGLCGLQYKIRTGFLLVYRARPILSLAGSWGRGVSGISCSCELAMSSQDKAVQTPGPLLWPALRAEVPPVQVQ